MLCLMEDQLQLAEGNHEMEHNLEGGASKGRFGQGENPKGMQKG